MRRPVDERSVGYALKRAQAALQAAMETALVPLGIGVSQYACLTLLAHRPAISNADLARGVFVSRQATHQLLAGLRAAHLVEVEGSGRAQRIRLSDRGRAVLDGAVQRIEVVEDAMLAPIPEDERERLRQQLIGCAEALEDARALAR